MLNVKFSPQNECIHHQRRLDHLKAELFHLALADARLPKYAIDSVTTSMSV